MSASSNTRAKARGINQYANVGGTGPCPAAEIRCAAMRHLPPARHRDLNKSAGESVAAGDWLRYSQDRAAVALGRLRRRTAAPDNRRRGEIALTDGDGATRAGFQLTRIVLIEDALGALDARKRNFGGAINARLGIDGEINQSGKGEQECEEQRKEQLRK